jgi:uncharacterized protein YdaU (DUF1376 family)
VHYYKRNIGDYHKKAGRLSILQHGVYMLLMDAIYDREKFPTLDEAIDWVWASSQDEIDAVKLVLSKFFTVDGEVFVQARISQELQEYAGLREINAINGKKGGRPKGKTHSVSKKTHSVSDKSDQKANQSESKPNHKPLTTNHKPITKEPVVKAKPKRFAPPCMQEVVDYCKQRSNFVDPQRFIDYYTSNGWKVGKNPMKDWKAAVRNWESKSNQSTASPKHSARDQQVDDWINGGQSGMVIDHE